MDSSEPAEREIRYGVPIAGTIDTIGPKTLENGCYSASVYAPPGSASIDFRILSTGSAREFTKVERDSAWEIGSRHMRAELEADQHATALCRAKYSAAANDTTLVAAVDAIVPYDTTRFGRLTCADLRRVDPRRTDPTYGVSPTGGA